MQHDRDFCRQNLRRGCGPSSWQNSTQSLGAECSQELPSIYRSLCHHGQGHVQTRDFTASLARTELGKQLWLGFDPYFIPVRSN